MIDGVGAIDPKSRQCPRITRPLGDKAGPIAQNAFVIIGASSSDLAGATRSGGTGAVMILARGTKLGPYEVLEPLGAGGMGEVYRARDTSLGRDVALKVLPEGFARNSDRIARFKREAQV